MRLRFLLLTLLFIVVPPSRVSEALAHSALPPESAVYRLEVTEGFCSGVAIAPARMLTARHCMPGVGDTDGPMSIPLSEDIVVALDPHGNVFRLKWVRYDTTDTALLELLPGQPYFPFGLSRSERSPQFLDHVSVIGYGCDSIAKLLVARGKRPGVFGFAIGPAEQHLVGILGHVCAGDSGGALVDADGDLLGILVSRGDDHRSAAVLLPELTAGAPPPNLFRN